MCIHYHQNIYLKKCIHAKPIVFILGIVMIMEFPLSLSVSSYIDQMSLICNAHTY